MRFLLTNDDGIDAPGLAALYLTASQFGEVTVVAPTEGLSGCSHRVTCDRPLHIHSPRPGWLAVDGTPADCVRIARCQLRLEIDYVLSGINAGGNLGADIWISGTVAAVREAAFFGWPGIAVSQYIRRGLSLNWSQAGQAFGRLLGELLLKDREELSFWNVNLPHSSELTGMPEWSYCPVDVSPMPVRYRPDGDGWRYDGDYHTRPRKPGSDVDICFGGRIAVSRVRLTT